jgi:hypothetical protein
VTIFWSHPPGSNRRPADYESAALPTELGWPTSAVARVRAGTVRREEDLILNIAQPARRLRFRVGTVHDSRCIPALARERCMRFEPVMWKPGGLAAAAGVALVVVRWNYKGGALPPIALQERRRPVDGKA